MTILHDTFTLERTYDATVPEVWRAYTDPELRQRWFHAPEGWELLERRYELREGGQEVLHGKMPNGTETLFVCTFHVIAPKRHIVTAYDMHVGGALLSVSLSTMQLAAAGKATRLQITEHGAYFDGRAESPRDRARGIGWHLDNMRELFAR